MIRTLATLALMCLAVPGLAQGSPIATPVPVVPRPATVRVAMVTSEGPIVLELEKERAPVTTANFLKYVDQKRLDGTTFYRALKVGPDAGLVQGGTRGDRKRSLPPILHEATSKTGLTHDDGAMSMARLAPGTASGDFFITIGALTSLDADPAKPGDNQGFAVFGHVVEGMDVVKKIVAAPTSPTAGEGSMKGQMILAPIKIVTVRRAN